MPLIICEKCKSKTFPKPLSPRKEALDEKTYILICGKCGFALSYERNFPQAKSPEPKHVSKSEIGSIP